MSDSRYSWPSKEQYDLSMEKWTETIFDDDLRRGTLYKDKMGIISWGGRYACLYRIGNWMVRCFHSNPPYEPPDDIIFRYKKIQRFCCDKIGQISALVPINCIEEGIVVGSRVLPIIKMPFIQDAFRLGEFIEHFHEKKDVMELLCDAWRCMIRELESAPMAHGDLDLTNVLVKQHDSNIILKLVDYDNSWIQELADCKQTELGHEVFQHPSFRCQDCPPRPYDAKMDRFSALVIYISIKALASQPALYDDEDWEPDEKSQLLFSADDYQNHDFDNSRIKRLRKLCSRDLIPYLDELLESLNECRMPYSLDDISHAHPPQKPLLFNWDEKVYTPTGNRVDSVIPPPTLSLSPTQSHKEVIQNRHQRKLTPSSTSFRDLTPPDNKPIDIAAQSAYVGNNVAPQKQIDKPTSLSAQIPKYRPRGHRLWMVALSMLLLIGVGSVIVGKPLFGRINPTATATSKPKQTATVIVANSDPYPPFSGKLALYDPLNSNSRGYRWENFTPNSIGESCQFIGRAYHVVEPQNYYLPCHTSLKASNFTFEVQMQIIKGICGGLSLRDTVPKAKAYYFQVCQDGTYGFYRYDGFTAPVQTLKSGSSATIITGLNRRNVIAIVANGSNFDLYINHQKISSVNDSTYSQGLFGVSADANTEAVYTNATMWTL